MTPQEVIDIYNSYQSASLPHRKKAVLEDYIDLIDNFCIWLKNQHASEHYLKTYLSKTFSYLLKENKQRAINPKVLFSKKMRQRYANQIIRLNFRSHELVNLDDKKEEYQMTADDLMFIDKSEETQKERFYNTEVGLLWCSENTTLWHPESHFCKACDFKEDCKQLQAEQYPTLYNKRSL